MASLLPVPSEDIAHKVALFREDAARRAKTDPDKVSDLDTLASGFIALRTSGTLFAGVYRAVIAFIADTQLSKKSVTRVALEQGFTPSRVSEFTRIAYGPEPIRRNFIAGKDSFRAALRASRDSTGKKRKKKAAAVTQATDIAANANVETYTDANGQAMLRVTITIPRSASVSEPLTILPEPPDGEHLRWKILVTVL